MKNRRPQRFSVAKAVKRNARERVGTPPPERVLPGARERARGRAGRYKRTLAGELMLRDE